MLTLKLEFYPGNIFQFFPQIDFIKFCRSIQKSSTIYELSYCYYVIKDQEQQDKIVFRKMGMKRLISLGNILLKCLLSSTGFDAVVRYSSGYRTRINVCTSSCSCRILLREEKSICHRYSTQFLLYGTGAGTAYRSRVNVCTMHQL